MKLIFETKRMPLVGGKARYDRRWYLNLLLEASEELFSPFGYGKEKIADELTMVKQVKLLSEVRHVDKLSFISNFQVIDFSTFWGGYFLKNSSQNDEVALVPILGWFSYI
jgi:hypothetical protein